MSTHGAYTQTFQSVASRYARLMGRKDGVQVTFGGEVAYTDGRLVNLPALPAGTTMTPREASVFGGYLDHETAHIRFKSFEGHKMSRKDNPVLFSIWNIVEDIRVENEQIALYPGSKSFLDDLCDEVDSMGKDRETEDAKAKETWGHKIFSMFYKEAWTKYRGVTSPREKDNLDDYPETRPIADIMRRDMPKMKSALDSKAIAEKIFASLPKNADFSQAAPSPGQKVKLCMNVSKLLSMMGQGQKPSQKPGSPMAGQGQPGQMEGVPASGKPMPGNSGAGDVEVELCDEKGNPLSASDKALLQAAMEAMQEGDRTNAMTGTIMEIQEKNDKEGGTKGAIKKPKKGGKIDTGKTKVSSGYQRSPQTGTRILPPVSTANDRIFVPSHENLSQYHADRAALSSEILATKKMLRIFLQSREKRAFSRGLEEGAFDEEEIASMMLGNRHVYMEKRDRQVINTDVAMMIDLSGSMNPDMIRQAGILIAESLEGIKKVSLAIYGFTTNGNRCIGPQDGGRSEGLDIYTFKEYEEPYRKVLGRLGGIGIHGSTPLGEGYAYAFESLVQRRTKRRVLWLVSDGEPAISMKNYDHDEFLLMKHIHTKCRTYGIETVGLGIGKGLRLKGFVDRYHEIQTCSQLPRSVLDMMKGIGSVAA